jgi:hypothetical protein
MDFIILALATWRLSNLLVNESGPYDVFERVRARVGVYYDDYGSPQGRNELVRVHLDSGGAHGPLISTWHDRGLDLYPPCRERRRCSGGWGALQ